MSKPRSHRSRSKRFAHAIIALSVLAIPQVGEAHQAEITVFCGAEPAPPLFVPIKAHAESCSIITTDVDDFEFAPTIDGRLARVIVTSDGEHIDPRLVVRDPLGQLLFDDWCDGGSIATPLPPCSVMYEFEPVLAGTYTAEVYEFGGDEADFYTLQLEMLPGETDDLIVLDEWVEFEQLLWRADMDHFRVALFDGDQLSIELESCDDYLDPKVQVWDLDDTLLIEDSCTTPFGPAPPAGGPTDCSNEIPGSMTLCTAYVEVDITAPGIYSFTISDEGSDEAGRYLYTLPEPGSIGLAAGLALLGVLARRRVRAEPRSASER